MSNSERQRLFRERHPGYFRKYRQRQKALRLEVKAAIAAQAAQLPAPTLLALPGEVALPAIVAPAPQAEPLFVFTTQAPEAREPLFVFAIDAAAPPEPLKRRAA